MATFQRIHNPESISVKMRSRFARNSQGIGGKREENLSFFSLPILPSAQTTTTKAPQKDSRQYLIRWENCVANSRERWKDIIISRYRNPDFSIGCQHRSLQLNIGVIQSWVICRSWRIETARKMFRFQTTSHNRVLKILSFKMRPQAKPYLYKLIQLIGSLSSSPSYAT